MKNGLESCIQTKQAQSMQFEFSNKQEIEPNEQKLPKKEDNYDDYCPMNQYTSLHTIIEDSIEADHNNTLFFNQ